jgi:hypothetical protein
VIEQCDRQLPFPLPAELREILATYGHGVIMQDNGGHGNWDSWGLHLWPPVVADPDVTSIVTMTNWKRDWYEDDDLITWGMTPGAGAWELAITRDGRIVDMAMGSPFRDPPQPRAYPHFKGEWYVIAGSMRELIERMASETGKHPFYWFQW